MALVRADRHLEQLDILPLADAETASLLSSLTGEARMSSAHVLLEDGTVRSGGAAVIEVARRVPTLFWLASLADRSALARRAVDAAYRGVAANRGRLSRLVPDTPPVRRRRPPSGPGG